MQNRLVLLFLPGSLLALTSENGGLQFLRFFSNSIIRLFLSSLINSPVRLSLQVG